MYNTLLSKDEHLINDHYRFSISQKTKKPHNKSHAFVITFTACCTLSTCANNICNIEYQRSYRIMHKYIYTDNDRSKSNHSQASHCMYFPFHLNNIFCGYFIWYVVMCYWFSVESENSWSAMVCNTVWSNRSQIYYAICDAFNDNRKYSQLRRS